MFDCRGHRLGGAAAGMTGGFAAVGFTLGAAAGGWAVVIGPLVGAAMGAGAVAALSSALGEARLRGAVEPCPARAVVHRGTDRCADARFPESGKGGSGAHEPIADNGVPAPLSEYVGDVTQARVVALSYAVGAIDRARSTRAAAAALRADSGRVRAESALTRWMSGARSRTREAVDDGGWLHSAG